MPLTIHRTRILAKAIQPNARAIMAHTSDGILSNTRIEVRPSARGLVQVTINQAERLPHHKRGVTHSLSFVISRAGLDHLVSVGS